MKRSAEQKFQDLKSRLHSMKRVIVAFSGGVDSTFLAQVAHEVLGENCLAITADSPSLARSELKDATSLAKRIGVPHEVIQTAEMQNPSYRENPTNRCYFCKTELFSRLELVRSERAFEAVLDGYNADDVGDYRPGQQAAREHLVRSPLQESGLRKREIRDLSAAYGLPTAEKPAMACLSSRIPYGTEVTPQRLHQIQEAEALLHELGFEQVRARHHEEIVRIEVEPAELPRLVAEPMRETVILALKKLGFRYIALDLAGYRSGSLNEVLVPVSALS